MNHTVLPTPNEKLHLKIRNWISKALKDFSQEETGQEGNIPLLQTPAGLEFHWNFLPVLWGEQVEGPVLVSLAPLGFVGLQGLADPVAITLDKKEGTPFLPL